MCKPRILTDAPFYYAPIPARKTTIFRRVRRTFPGKNDSKPLCRSYTFRSVESGSEESKSSYRDSPPAKTIRWSVNGQLYVRGFLSAWSVPLGRKKKRKNRGERGRRTIEEEARGSKKGSLVNARENWLLNLAAGMSSAPPRGYFTPARSTHDPFYRFPTKLEGMRNWCG